MGWASWMSSVQGEWNACCTLGVKPMDREWGQPLEQWGAQGWNSKDFLQFIISVLG